MNSLIVLLYLSSLFTDDSIDIYDMTRKRKYRIYIKNIRYFDIFENIMKLTNPELGLQLITGYMLHILNSLLESVGKVCMKYELSIALSNSFYGYTL